MLNLYNSTGTKKKTGSYLWEYQSFKCMFVFLRLMLVNNSNVKIMR